MAFGILTDMAKRPSTSSRIVELAKRGAEARLEDLVHEVKLLIQLFPHLRDSFDKEELPLKFIVARNSGKLTKRVKRGRRKGAKG